MQNVFYSLCKRSVLGHRVLRWCNTKGYYQGVFWTLMLALVSNIDDALMKLVGMSLDSMEIVFLRYSFSTIILFPFALRQSPTITWGENHFLHILRVIIGFLGIYLWCIGLQRTPLFVATAIGLGLPLLLPFFASILLRERLTGRGIIAVVISFLGASVIILGQGKVNSIMDGSLNEKVGGILILVSSTLFFCFSDILNKKLLQKESVLNLIFYFVLGVSVLSLIPAIFVWKKPSIHQLCLFGILGINTNILMWCLLKSLDSTKILNLAPYRYSELIFSGVFGYILLNETPNFTDIVGIFILILLIVFLTVPYSTLNLRRKKRNG